MLTFYKYDDDSYFASTLRLLKNLKWPKNSVFPGKVCMCFLETPGFLENHKFQSPKNMGSGFCASFYIEQNSVPAREENKSTQNGILNYILKLKS